MLIKYGGIRSKYGLYQQCSYAEPKENMAPLLYVITV